MHDKNLRQTTRCGYGLKDKNMVQSKQSLYKNIYKIAKKIINVLNLGFVFCIEHVFKTFEIFFREFMNIFV